MRHVYNGGRHHENTRTRANGIHTCCCSASEKRLLSLNVDRVKTLNLVQIYMSFDGRFSDAASKANALWLLSPV